MSTKSGVRRDSSPPFALSDLHRVRAALKANLGARWVPRPRSGRFAFISDVGARNLAMGYLPLVVCSNRAANPVEQLLP